MVQEITHLIRGVMHSLLLGGVAHGQEADADKTDRPFPLSSPIHGYKYGQVINLAKRGFFTIAVEYRLPSTTSRRAYAGFAPMRKSTPSIRMPSASRVVPLAATYRR